MIYATDIVNQTRATVRWWSGTSITGRGNMLSDGGVMEASTPLLCICCGQASVILCIIDGKVRIAEVMRWEGAAKQQGGQAHCWQAGVGSRAWGSKHCRGWEGSWSNRSSQRSRTKCHPPVNQTLPIPKMTFWLSKHMEDMCWSYTGSCSLSWCDRKRDLFCYK